MWGVKQVPSSTVAVGSNSWKFGSVQPEIIELLLQAVPYVAPEYAT